MNFIRIVLVCIVLGAAAALPAKTLIDLDFAKRPQTDAVCEGKTVRHFLGNPASLALGGPSKTGEKAGIRVSAPEPFSVFDFTVVDLHWSHENALGGHPTEFLFLNELKQGYVIAFFRGGLTVFRQDGPEQRARIADFPKLWSPADGMTVKRRLEISRADGGRWTVKLTGVEQPIAFTDDEYSGFSAVTITYGVYVHGYACIFAALRLTVPSGARTAELLFFNPWRKSPSPVTEIVDALNRAGVAARSFEGTAASLLPARTAALVLPGSSLSEEDLRGALDFLRNGGRVILWGEIDWNLSSPAGRRFQERILGAPAPRPRQCADFRLTPEGAAFFGDALSGAGPESLALLPRNNTIENQTLREEVETVDLAVADYRMKNWIQRVDVFCGTPLQLTIHHGGEFAGARVLYAGLPRAFLAADAPKLAAFVRGALAALDRPARKSTPRFSGARELTRENFFEYPGAAAGALCFAGYGYLDDKIFDEDMAEAGFQFAMYCIPWLPEITDGEVVDWQRLDSVIAAFRAKGFKVMLDPYPYNFNISSFKWLGGDRIYHPEIEKRWLKAIADVARRYKDEPAVVAMWCSPFTHTGDFKLSESDGIRRLWAAYLKETKSYTLDEINRRYGLELKTFDDLPYPSPNPALPFNIGPMWEDYLDFHIAMYQNLLRKSIRAIRAEAPDMPLAIRTTHMDPAPAMAVAAEFPHVSAHIECIETSVDTEGYFRSLAQNYNIPVTAENGWPKATPAAMNFAFADLMLGNYPVFLYSFGGPRWLRHSYPELRRYAVVRQETARAVPPRPELGLVLPDTTLFGSRPASFLQVEKYPNLVLSMEQSGVPFYGVSSALPKLDGLKVLIDAGNNRIFTRGSIRIFEQFLKAGGTFIAFPSTGEYAFDGGKGFFESLGIPRKSGTYRIGDGGMIVLKDVVSYQNDPAALVAALKSVGVKPFVETNRPVCSALFEDGGRKYLVLCSKSRELVGSYFTESRHAAAVAGLETLKLELRVNFPFRRVRTIPEKRPVTHSDGTVFCRLRPTECLVLLFE